MNELVTAERGILIPRGAHRPAGHGDVPGLPMRPELPKRSNAHWPLDEAQCEALGEAARRFFLDNDARSGTHLPAWSDAWLEAP